MFADLFLFTDPANYNIALNMLSGSVYANYLNSFPSLGVHENDLTDHATNCEIPALAGSVLECRSSAPIHVWGQLDYQTRKADGDIEAGESRSKRFTGLLGIDFNAGNSAIFGVDAGYLSNNVHDNQFGDSAKGNGWTAGAYAVYDPGAFFVKGVTTYSSLNGNSTRHINFAGLATGATFAATPTGSPDVKMWTFGLHGGARLPMSATSVLTPYLNYDYVNAKLDGFDREQRQWCRADGRQFEVEPQLPHRGRQVGDPDGRRGSGSEPWLSLPLRQQLFQVPRLVHSGSCERLRHRLGLAEEGHVPCRPQRWREDGSGRHPDRL